MDIEEAFDSLDHNFLISTLEKYGFGQNFILRFKILLKGQESCVINDVKTKKYFLLGRGVHESPNFSFFSYFSVRDLIVSYKDKT